MSNFGYPTDDNPNEPSALAIMDIKADEDLNAILGILRTLFVCVILTAGAMYFSKDANDLVL